MKDWSARRSRYVEITYALLRFFAGILLACHGAQKLFGAFGAQAADNAADEVRRRDRVRRRDPGRCRPADAVGGLPRVRHDGRRLLQGARSPGLLADHQQGRARRGATRSSSCSSGRTAGDGTAWMRCCADPAPRSSPRETNESHRRGGGERRPSAGVAYRRAASAHAAQEVVVLRVPGRLAVRAHDEDDLLAELAVLADTPEAVLAGLLELLEVLHWAAWSAARAWRGRPPRGGSGPLRPRAARRRFRRNARATDRAPSLPSGSFTAAAHGGRHDVVEAHRPLGRVDALRVREEDGPDARRRGRPGPRSENRDSFPRARGGRRRRSSRSGTRVPRASGSRARPSGCAASRRASSPSGRPCLRAPAGGAATTRSGRDRRRRRRSRRPRRRPSS